MMFVEKPGLRVMYNLKFKIQWVPGGAAVVSAAAALVAMLLQWPVPLTAGFIVLSAAGGGATVYFVVRLMRQMAGFTALCGTGSDSPEELAQTLKKHLEGSAQKLIAVEQQKSDLALQFQLLQRQSGSVESILDTICDAVLVTDEKDRIVLCNRTAQSLLNFTFDKNQPFEAGRLNVLPELSKLIEKTRTSRVAHVRHELQVEKDGQAAFYEAVFSSLEDAGRVVQVVTVLHDITRQKEIARMKNDFVSHVSHELKTPLASINAYAEMLTDGEAQDEETLKQFCSIIQGQAQRLNRLIEDILNISRIESGLIKVTRDSHSMTMIIRDAVAMIASYAQEKNISLTAPAEILYDQVYIDHDMMAQVVINLLSNAVKYTPAGGQITIGSELNELDGTIKVTVKDTGVGIPPEAVDHLFEKFYRVEANNKYAKGTGLGLNLVKQIVETVHGGRVFVTSTPGQGSIFGFVLPLLNETAPVS